MFDQAREYLARVLPWPQQGEAPSYVDIIWSFQSTQHAGKGWSGRAVSTVDDAIRAMTFALKSPDTLDIYVCQSTQREAQEIVSQKGFKYLKPVRLAENAVLLKSLFLDIDGDKIGDDVKGYPTMAEAVKALGTFIKAVGLPKPSMMVTSGGGLHIYWTMSRALTPQEWYPLACAMIEATKRHGLKLDAACTTDAARILRIPDTFNRKLEPKRAVKIAGTPQDFDYTVERIAKALEPYKVDAVFMAQRTGGGTSLTFELPPTGVAPRAPVAGTSDLAAGVETAMPQAEVRACLDAIPNTKVDWNAWNNIGMRVYAATEGADYGLAEWQRWSDTNPVAGAKDSCDARWQTLHSSPPTRTGAGALVNEARAATGDPKWQARTFTPVLAAPAAVTPQVTGFGGAPVAPVAAGGAVAGAALPAGVVALTPMSSADLPAGYTRGPTGIVSLIGVNEDGTPNVSPISDYPLTDPVIQKDPWALHFDTTTQRGRKQRISIELEHVGSNEMRKILQSQGLMLRVRPQQAMEFFVAWIQKLQSSRDAINSAPYGWSTKNGKVEGFVYGGMMFTPTGDLASANPDPVIARQYAPQGDLQPWLDAAELVTLQGRPDLDAVLASAFAAPLVRFAGDIKGLLMSVYSQESGVGKTTALSVAQAVWGDPMRMQGTSDTLNSVFGKMGQLKSLPIYWDEIKGDEETKKFVQLTFQLSKGTEKSRMRANTTQREAGTWQTLLVSATNDSLIDYIVGNTTTTTAGLMRVFEFEIAPGTKHQIARSDASRISGLLNDNYGSAGLIYARFLGVNSAQVDKDYAELARALGIETNETKEERFWSVLITCILLGARYANTLGLTKIDEAELKKFMFAKLEKMRGERNSQPVDMRQAINVSNMLAQFFNAMQARHTLYTNRIHITAGKPPANTIKVVRPADRVDGIYVHVGELDKLVRISATYLSTWLKDQGLSRHIFKHALETELGCKLVRGRIGSGTQFAGATEYLLELDLAGHPLANFIDEA